MSRKTSKFKNAKIPLHVCFKLALKNMWKKKFRFIIMIIICSISLAFLSFTIELNGDKIRQNVYTMVANNYNYTDIKEYLPLDKQSEKENIYNKYNSVSLSNNAYTDIKNKIPNLNIFKYEEVKIKYAGKNVDIATSFFPGYIQTIFEYDSSNEYELIAGRLPIEGTKEILITDYLVAAFNHFDVMMDEGTYYDYLNHYIDLNISNNYKIVGILKTNFDKWVSETGFKSGEVDETDKVNFAYLNDFKVMNAIVLTKDYFNIEKVNSTGTTTFTKYNKNRSEWLIIGNPDEESSFFIPNELSFSSNNIGVSYYEYFVNPGHQLRRANYGHTPNTNDEICVPRDWVESLCGIEFDDLTYADYYNLLDGMKVNITLTPSLKDKSFNKTFTIVGISNSDDTILITSDTLEGMNEYTQDSDNVLVKLPNDSQKAYRLFNQVYQKGYVIDVWKYRNDVDSYVVDPFINILSKAGLVVFVSFTIGIMWTIITIEIVDSKKEIGILRSIGLSGVKVSSIFIIQSLIVNIISYGLAIVIANQVLTFYNTGIMDELNLITLDMYMLTYRTPLYLFIFVILITLISTIAPLYKIMSQKIIDVINERE